MLKIFSVSTYMNQYEPYNVYIVAAESRESINSIVGDYADVTDIKEIGLAAPNITEPCIILTIG